MRDIRSPKDMPHARHQLAVMYETGPRQGETAARMSQHLGFRVHPEELRIAHERHAHHGHWRQQYYASADEHRPKWIHSYLKGDPSLPLLVTEKVMVWRR